VRCFKIYLLIILCNLLSIALFAQSKNNCEPQSATEVPLLRSDVRMAKNYEEANNQFTNIYNRAQRLRNRIFWSKEKNQFISQHNNQTIAVDELFITHLIQIIESALNQSFADFLYYGDMGHAHIFERVSTQPKSKTEELLKNKEMKLLFHVAELFEFKKNRSKEFSTNPWLVDRYNKRNFLATNDTNSLLKILFEPPPSFNTVRKIDNHQEVSALYFSANKNGCFYYVYKGVTYNFDISFNP
jgi:hypothetical protein